MRRVSFVLPREHKSSAAIKSEREREREEEIYRKRKLGFLYHKLCCFYKFRVLILTRKVS